MATAATAAVEAMPTRSLPATPMLPRWLRLAAVERTPAAVSAHGTQRGARLAPWVYTRQSSQKGRRQARHMPVASSNRCLSHRTGCVIPTQLLFGGHQRDRPTDPKCFGNGG